MDEHAETPRKKWLLAGWPGMGNVAIIGAGYLINQLGLQPVKELGGRSYFDVGGIGVKRGLVVPPRLPRSVLFRREEPFGEIDLTVFMGEAQPTSNSLGFAHELLDEAAAFGVERVFTFASMATQLQPTGDPAVHAFATEASLLDELDRLEVKRLHDGEIGGMNGVLLGACTQRRLGGIGLLGEIPYYAARVPNPKAARAVLETFALAAGAELDLSGLDEHVETIDHALIRMQEQIEQQGDEAGETPAPEAAGPADRPAQPKERSPDLAARQRIEDMFEQARKDRAKAVDLKQELDRLGAFEKYEDRFLDLFRRGE